MLQTLVGGLDVAGDAEGMTEVEYRNVAWQKGTRLAARAGTGRSCWERNHKCDRK